MNIVHFTHGKVNPFGESGMSRTVYYLNKYQKINGHHSQILSVVDGITEHQTLKRDEFVSVEMFPRVFSLNSKRKEVLQYIKDNKNRIDIVHFHLMWLYDKNIVANLLKKMKIPYVVTTHGAYAKTSIRNVWWKKIPAKYLYELNFLNGANAIHALCYEELTRLREFGINAPIFIVPNGIELGEIPGILDDQYLFTHHDIPKEKVKLAWIGIIKPVKNLEGLIYSATLLPDNIKDSICFVIVGPDVKGYRNHLESITRKWQIDKMFYFVGPKYGKDKYDAIASSDLYIHPSWSEGISFAILDAMACGKPCILTRTSNMTYYLKNNFFWMVEPWPDDIARGIVEMINNRNIWELMGSNAKKLLHNQLNWQKINEQLLLCYKNVLDVSNG